MGFAPEIPSTDALHAIHPLSNEGRQKVYEKRREAADALKFGHKLLAIVGPCAMTGDEAAVLDENRRMAEFAEKNDMVILHRLPPWKPRTNPDSWHGLETTSPEEAHRITVAIAEQSGNLAMEFGCSEHIRRYMGQAALGWRGSRNDEEGHLLTELVRRDDMLPVGIKNGMSGATDLAAAQARSASVLRGSPGSAPVTMIFRGGEGLRNVPDWLTEYANAFRRTDGHFIVDVAHGSEQAHDPRLQFAKSAMGQLACLDSIISVAGTTDRLPRGVMIEASDLASPTDPVVPLDAAFEALERLAFTHRRTLDSSRHMEFTAAD